MSSYLWAILNFCDLIGHVGSQWKGAIYVWAAGNGGSNFDSCAADGFSSSIYTISVGAADEHGREAYFDEQCSSKMAVAYAHNSYAFPSPTDSWKAYRQVVSIETNLILCTLIEKIASHRAI